MVETSSKCNSCHNFIKNLAPEVQKIMKDCDTVCTVFAEPDGDYCKLFIDRKDADKVFLFHGPKNE